MQGALRGIRVIDMSRVLAGPWASQLLADYGADVIKIERPGAGDDTRHWGPPWLQAKDGTETGESAYFLATNRNKRSITVDITNAEGQAVLRQLAGSADVVIENFRVGTLARYGLDADSLRASHPELIYCSISAYGQAGSRAGEAGYDAMIQGAAGLMSLTGDPDGVPQKTGVAVADIMAGMYAASAILAALHARQASGEGQVIDVPLYDSQVAWLANQAMNYLVSGEVPARCGNGHPNIVPYQAFETADGFLMLAVGNDRQFTALCDCLGRSDLATDERFASNRDRVAHRDLLVPMLAECFRATATAAWLARLTDAGVPCGPINDLAGVFDGEQVAERGLRQSLPHPLAGRVPTVANPVRFSGTPPRLELAPPLLGQHTQEVLAELLGYSAEKIAALREAGAI